MSRRSVKELVPVVAAAAALVVSLGSGWVVRSGTAASGTGDPERGDLVWHSSRCGTCHRFARAGTTGKTGPNIDRWLVPHAKRARMPVGLFVLSRVVWGGRGMPPYLGELSSQEMDDLVSFVVGQPFTAPARGVTPVPSFQIPPLVTADRRTVERWIRLEGLPGSAVRGALVFAREGCLSCHRYLGSGVRRYGARNLTTAGKTKRTAAYLRRYVSRPYLWGNTLMPSYADLGDTNLRAVAEFLAASTGRVR